MALEQQHKQLRHTLHLFLRQKSAVMSNLMDSPIGVENRCMKMTLQFERFQAELESYEVELLLYQEPPKLIVTTRK